MMGNLALNRLSDVVLLSLKLTFNKCCVFLKTYLGACQRSVVEVFAKIVTQPAFICSNLTIETLEQGVEYVQS